MEAHERVSAKLSKFRSSLTLGLKRLVEDRRRSGLPVYDFGLGETKGNLDPAIRDAGERAFREERTMYTDPAGLAELREAVLHWLGLRDWYGPENVLISTGAKQSLFNIFLAVCNPGDAVLLDAALVHGSGFRVTLTWSPRFRSLDEQFQAEPGQVRQADSQDRELACL